MAPSEWSRVTVKIDGRPTGERPLMIADATDPSAAATAKGEAESAERIYIARIPPSTWISDPVM